MMLIVKNSEEKATKQRLHKILLIWAERLHLDKQKRPETEILIADPIIATQCRKSRVSESCSHALKVVTTTLHTLISQVHGLAYL